MSKERLLKTLGEFHQDHNWLCYEFDRELNRLYLYENSRMVATFFLDDYELVMSNVIGVSMQSKKIVRVVVAKYIVEEEALRNKKFYLRMKNPVISRDVNFLNLIWIENECEIDDSTEDDWYQTKFTESDIDRFKEEIDGFSELLELFEREYVEGE